MKTSSVSYWNRRKVMEKRQPNNYTYKSSSPKYAKKPEKKTTPTKDLKQNKKRLSTVDCLRCHKLRCETACRKKHIGM